MDPDTMARVLLSTAEIHGEGCSHGGVDTCTDKEAATRLRVWAIFVILTVSLLGAGLPMLGGRVKWLHSDGNLFFVAKAFSAGVILSVAFVHMLPEATEKLSSPCLSDRPWHKFPWAGFFALVGVLVTQLIDFVATQFYTRQAVHNHSVQSGQRGAGASPEGGGGSGGGVNGGGGDCDEGDALQEKQPGEEEAAAVAVVGVHVHAASHVHNEGTLGHSHPHFGLPDGGGGSRLRHVIVAQVLELGIGLHSVLIGIDLGTSSSPCTIRPLLSALVFHQFFEGFALGGCIAQARFGFVTSAVMAGVFAVTTPTGIAVGMAIASAYDENSTTALVTGGVLDAVATGVLIYLGLVDVIAHDFLSHRMRTSFTLQCQCYTALFFGSAAMAVLALWA